MKFIEIMLANSAVKEAKLYNAAKKASINPATGVTIQNSSAFHVIKDSAMIAVRYLPHFIFAQYQDPFSALKGKFTKNDIIEFVQNTNSDFSNLQLLTLILSKIKNINEDKTTVKTPTPTVTGDIEASDPYGDYGSGVYTEAVQSDDKVDKDAVQLLCEAFGVPY
jgi:hypothetical protein